MKNQFTKKFETIAQNYLGMTPNDKGCETWNQMQEKMVSELNEVVNSILKTSTNTNVQSKFKKGQWLIRRWDISGETDFTVFDKQLDKERFIHTNFCRFKDNKRIWPPSKYKNDVTSTSHYIDDRLSMQWRVVTTEEMESYKQLNIFQLTKK